MKKGEYVLSVKKITINLNIRVFLNDCHLKGSQDEFCQLFNCYLFDRYELNT